MKHVKNEFDGAKLESQSEIRATRSGSRGCLFGTAHTAVKHVAEPVLYAVENEPANMMDARKKRV